jgi:hypothetical protein
MYFPYLRGKQFELALLKELSIYLAESGKIVPIIEPVNRKLGGIEAFVKILNKTEAPYALVINPNVGELKGSTIEILEGSALLPHPNAYLAMIINRSTTTDSISDFLLEQDSGCKCLLLHYAEMDDVRVLLEATKRLRKQVIHAFIEGDVGQQYINSFRGLDRVVIRDSFRKAERNADYRDRDGEFFSDLHTTFKNDGFLGFGDYTTIGKAFTKGGGTPYTVAVHITYPHRANNSLRIRHFLSDRLPNTDADVAGKLQEALAKMRAYIDGDSDPCECGGCTELMAIHERGSNHGLGIIKKLSIHHHLKTTEAFL